VPLGPLRITPHGYRIVDRFPIAKFRSMLTALLEANGHHLGMIGVHLRTNDLPMGLGAVIEVFRRFATSC
jgi:hypothetical protein